MSGPDIETLAWGAAGLLLVQGVRGRVRALRDSLRRGRLRFSPDWPTRDEAHLARLIGHAVPKGVAAEAGAYRAWRRALGHAARQSLFQNVPLRRMGALQGQQMVIRQMTIGQGLFVLMCSLEPVAELFGRLAGQQKADKGSQGDDLGLVDGSDIGVGDEHLSLSVVEQHGDGAKASAGASPRSAPKPPEGSV